MAESELGILGTMLFSFVLLFVGLSAGDTIITPAFLISGIVGVVASAGALFGLMK